MQKVKEDVSLQTVGQAIRKLRKQKKYTLKEFAEVVKSGYSYVHCLEKGKIPTSLGFIKRLQVIEHDEKGMLKLALDDALEKAGLPYTVVLKQVG